MPNFSPMENDFGTLEFATFDLAMLRQFPRDWCLPTENGVVLEDQELSSQPNKGRGGFDAHSYITNLTKQDENVSRKSEDAGYLCMSTTARSYLAMTPPWLVDK
jgi:hypothetical protein